MNQWYTTGDIAWILVASALVLLMIPGVGFFYSGLTGTKSALSLIMLSFITLSVVSFQVCIPPARHDSMAVVLLGILSSILKISLQIPREHGKCRIHGRSSPEIGVRTRYSICFISGHVRRIYPRHRHWRSCRTRKNPPLSGIRITLEYPCIRPNCFLDMESLWLGL